MSFETPDAQSSLSGLTSTRQGNLLLDALIRTWRTPSGKIGALLVGLLMFVAIAAPLVAPYDPARQFRGQELEGPSLSHPIGTDQLGRDLLSRVIFGGRASFLAGVVAASFGIVVGISSGTIAGYNGGSWLDAVIMRFYDGLLIFPAILLAIAIVAITGPGLLNVALAIGVAETPVSARLTRSIVLSQRERDYVEAARSIGASGRRIALFHILPNTLPLLLVPFSLSVGFAILTEGALSFLGLGVQPPTPSWGGMLGDSRQYMTTQVWYGVTPGLALCLLLVGLNLLSDALQKGLDPRRIA